MLSATLPAAHAPAEVTAADRSYAAALLDDGSRRSSFEPLEVRLAEFARHDAEAPADEDFPSEADLAWWEANRDRAADEEALSAEDLDLWRAERDEEESWREYGQWADSLEAAGCVDAGVGDIDQCPARIG